MEAVEKCTVCGSTLAANRDCPDCGAPEEDPDWLDDYGYVKDEEKETGRAPRNEPVAGQPTNSCRVLQFPKPEPAPLTPEELYAGRSTGCSGGSQKIQQTISTQPGMRSG